MPRKITIFQMDDTENSPKAIDIGASSMMVLYSPVACIRDLLERRKEFENPGVYILKFDSDDSNYPEIVYVGEAENLKTRIKQHLTDDKQNFIECISVVSTKEGELTKAHIKNMESRLYQEINVAKGSKLMNSSVPTLSTLSDADECIIDDFIDKLKIVLPLCGFKCLIPVTALKITVENVYSIDSKGKGIHADMIIADNAYIVLKNSTACKEVTKSFSYNKQRDKLIDSGVLVIENGLYKFIDNTKFNSASQASSVVFGAMSNGLDSWKDSMGKTLKDS
jgi:hypothetical protein